MKKIYLLFLPLVVTIIYCNQSKNDFTNNLILNVESQDNEAITIEFNREDELFFLIEKERFILSTHNPKKEFEIYFEFPGKMKLKEHNSFNDKEIKFSCVLNKGKQKNYFISNKILNFSFELKKVKGAGQVAEGFFTVYLENLDKNKQGIRINGNFELKITSEMFNSLRFLKLSSN